jgi:hypothetical protein
VLTEDRLDSVVLYRRIGWAGRHRLRAVQQERERVPLRLGERGCCLGQFSDPGIQAAAGVTCGVHAVVVTCVALGPSVPPDSPSSASPSRPAHARRYQASPAPATRHRHTDRHHSHAAQPVNIANTYSPPPPDSALGGWECRCGGIRPARWHWAWCEGRPHAGNIGSHSCVGIVAIASSM